MNKNLNLGLEELISSAIEKSVANAFRKEKLNLKKETPFKKIGGIDLAVEITGLTEIQMLTLNLLILKSNSLELIKEVHRCQILPI